jgi:leucyl/phenylalanyl-tRNA---protein transferase
MVPWLDPRLPIKFPETSEALEYPNGLLAAGGQLSPDWLVKSYSKGIFPWFNEGEPILWWSPAPRAVLFPEDFRINRSFRKFLNKSSFHVTVDQRFREVMQACAESRPGQPGTWISKAMMNAYNELHKAGFAHSYECWNEDNVMIGGLYGVALGEVFFGESMFRREDYASRYCLKFLVDSGKYKMVDCQMKTDHLMNVGAREISREYFESLLRQYIQLNDESDAQEII